MSYMFYECSSLRDLDISNFNIKKETNIDYMFYECYAEVKNKFFKDEIVFDEKFLDYLLDSD